MREQHFLHDLVFVSEVPVLEYEKRNTYQLLWIKAREISPYSLIITIMEIQLKSLYKRELTKINIRNTKLLKVRNTLSKFTYVKSATAV
ncbi:hypothetical protein [Ferroplasma acidarmanus]|uniref:hypothetical protein n=1 Tax=Ferroplasma acidarmanus TaxID=97393 RepID=UPI00003C8509|nr:hypothetical protein [Ferroplasma acidarmanus]